MAHIAHYRGKRVPDGSRRTPNFNIGIHPVLTILMRGHSSPTDSSASDASDLATMSLNRHLSHADGKLHVFDKDATAPDARGLPPRVPLWTLAALVAPTYVRRGSIACPWEGGLLCAPATRDAQCCASRWACIRAPIRCSRRRPGPCESLTACGGGGCLGFPRSLSPCLPVSLPSYRPPSLSLPISPPSPLLPAP